MQRRLLNNLGLALAFVAAVALFQNCTPSAVSLQSNETGSERVASSGNGQGYDGKVFVAGVCEDGSLRSKITFRLGLAYLLRDECVNLPNEKLVSVQTPPTSNELIVNGTRFTEVAATTCTSLPTSITRRPVIDISAASYSGSGLVKNAGSAGVIYDFQLGDGVSSALNPTFSGASPARFTFDGGDYLSLTRANSTFLNSLHKKSTRFSIAWEGYLPNGENQGLLSTGSWSNSAGVALLWNGQAFYLQVGNGDGQESYDCAQFNSLCLTAPTLPASARAPTKLFAGVSLDEAANHSILRTNSAQIDGVATYRKESTVNAGHDLTISSKWVYPLQDSARVYRVRLWDAPLTSIQLRDLELHSSSYCPW